MGCDEMIKKIIGISIIVVLIGIVIFNVIEKYISEPSRQAEEDTLTTTLVPPQIDGLAVGDEVAPFTLETMDGSYLNIADLKGKKIILNFWASWCGPCKAEMPDMQKFYENHKDEVEIIAINMTGKETNFSDAEEFVEAYELTFPILLDHDLELSDKYGIMAIPTTYFIGTDMTYQLPPKLGPMTYDEMIEKMEDIN